MRYLRAPPFLGVGGVGRRAGAPPGRSSSGRCRPLMAALDLFSDPARDWFRQAFGEPTDVQEKGWLEVAAGRHTLMSAPTGSGKTLAAFYWCLDRLAGEPIPAVDARCRVLYVSPLKALTVDVERNLRAPPAGRAVQAERLGLPIPAITVGARTGDTAPAERRQLNRRPPDILITTPESLFLLLTSAARSMLRSVRWVIVDEIHSLAPNKRGAHLALSLERLAARTAVDPQRIGLSATVRPLDEVARFLGGTDREVAIVDAGRRKSLEVTVEVPVDDQRRQRDPADRPLRPLGGRHLQGRDHPQVSGRPSGVGGGRRANAGGRDRDDHGALEPSRRAGPAGGSDVGIGRMAGRRAGRARPPRPPLSGSRAAFARLGARHAERPLPL